MQFIKGWIGIKSEDDEIPEIKLQRNEPIVYYDPVRKRYIIEGENLAEPIKPSEPPKNSKPKTFDSPLKAHGKNGAPSSRYFNALGKEHILQTPEPLHQAKSTEPTHDKTKQEKLREIDMELNKEKPAIDNISEVHEPKPKDKRSDDDDSGKDKEKTQFENEVQMSEIEQKDDVESSFAVKDYYDQHPEVEKLKAEFKAKMIEMQAVYQEEINQLKESVLFYEEGNEESTTLLKNQITNFINKNLELEMNCEKAKEELLFKQKEIEEYQKLFEYYRKLVDENSIAKQETAEDTKQSNEGSSFERSNKPLGSDYVYINSKIEKLETEKIILNNDLIVLKSENESIKLEKDYLIKKASALETQNSKIKEDLHQVESSLKELSGNYKSMHLIKEDLEQKIASLKQEAVSSNTVITDKKHLITSLQRNIDENNKRMLQLTSQIESIQSKNEALSKELRSVSDDFGKAVDGFSIEKQQMLRQIEADSEFYDRKIELLLIDRDSLLKELDECSMQLIKASDDIDLIEALKTEKFKADKALKQATEQTERIKEFILEQKANYPSMANELKINNDDFDKELCGVIMNMIAMTQRLNNSIEELKADKAISFNENDILKVEISLLKSKMAQDAQRNHKLLYKTINDANQSISALKSVNALMVPKKYKNDFQSAVNQLNEEKQRTAMIAEENEELKGKVLTLMQMLKNCKGDYENQLQSQLNSHSEEKQELLKQLAEEQQGTESHLKLVTDKEIEIKALTSTQAELTEQCKQSSSECHVMKDKIKELMEILSSMQEESEADVQSQSVVKEEYEKEILVLTEKVNVLAEQVKGETDQKELLEKGLKELYDEITRLNQMNKELKEENQRIAEEYEGVKCECAQAKEELLVKEREKEAMREEHSEKMAKIESDNKTLEKQVTETIMLLKQFDRETGDDWTNTDIEEEKVIAVKEEKAIQYDEKEREEEENRIIAVSKEKENDNKPTEQIKLNGRDEKEEILPQSQAPPEPQPQPQKLGFLGRLMAPLFLTEKEYATLEK